MLCHLIGRLCAYIACVSIRVPIYLSYGSRQLKHFLIGSSVAYFGRLRGHFGELSLQSSGSFTVEKCFTVGNISLREAIVSELLTVQSELWNTKQGPHLMRKLDVDG